MTRSCCREAAKKSGLCEKIFENFDERPKSLLYSIAMDSYMFALPGSGVGDSLEQQVYLATFNTIRHIADQGPCVIIGRCADYALADYPNHLSLFISAPLEVRIQRVAQRQNLTPEKARQLILKTDKRRASYYEYYSSKKWGSVDSYHFCIDSSYLGLGRTVELIQAWWPTRSIRSPAPRRRIPPVPGRKRRKTRRDRSRTGSGPVFLFREDNSWAGTAAHAAPGHGRWSRSR